MIGTLKGRVKEGRGARNRRGKGGVGGQDDGDELNRLTEVFEPPSSLVLSAQASTRLPEQSTAGPRASYCRM